MACTLTKSPKPNPFPSIITLSSPHNPPPPKRPTNSFPPSAGEMRQAGVYSGIMLGKKNGPHPLPLSRIKKIMKQSGEDVKMISCESPLVFTKACELFIQELTCRAYKFTLQGKRRTVRKEDIAAAVTTTDVFDFLVDMVSASVAEAAAVKTET